jgi:hypothetical protein
MKQQPPKKIKLTKHMHSFAWHEYTKNCDLKPYGSKNDPAADYILLSEHEKALHDTIELHYKSTECLEKQLAEMDQEIKWHEALLKEKDKLIKKLNISLKWVNGKYDHRFDGLINFIIMIMVLRALFDLKTWFSWLRGE